VADALSISWWEWLPGRKLRIVVIVESADEIPQRLPHNGVALVGPRRNPKWIAFDCPCRTGHRIMLNADRARWPYWSLNKKGDLTITPSVDYEDSGKRCHFIVRNGRVSWVYGRDII
jgi:hypothetical protein